MTGALATYSSLQCDAVANYSAQLQLASLSYMASSSLYISPYLKSLVE